MAQRSSERFLSAFVAIEGILRSIHGSKRYVPFYQLVDHGAAVNEVVRSYQVELKEYADLRNAIVHERIDGSPIAEPHEATVVALEKILSQVSSPPTVELYLKDVIVCSPDDPIGTTTSRMLQRGFSQIPVYGKGSCVGVLSSDTIARWLAAKLASGEEQLIDERVRAVLEYSGDKPHHTCIGRQATIFEAISLFEYFNRQGTTLLVLLITETGSSEEEPLGIITMGDLPRLFETVELRHIEWK